MLQLAHAHVRWMLYRPFLQFVSQGFRAEELDKRLYICAEACVSASRNIIDITRTIQAEGLRSGAHWFPMHASYFATLTLIYPMLEKTQVPMHNTDVIESAFEGMNVLGALARNGVAIERCPRLPWISIFAAGGIVDDRGVAASLCLEASRVVMGTRFLASHEAREARISPGFQNEILRANNGAVSTTRTLLYNHLRSKYRWPEDYVPRTIINTSFIKFCQGSPFEELRELWQEVGDEESLAWGPEGRRGQYVGASIGLIHEVRDAAEIVQDVRDKAVARIRSLQK
ncbi:hypothetical protein ACHAPV_004747 [Trichoderma viride]